MPGMESDAEAIARSLLEPGAFRAVFDRHYPVIRRYLFNRVANASVAEDLAAETFLRAFAGRAGYTPQASSARAWLFAIATNLLRDEGRAGARRRSLIERLRHERADCGAPLPEGPDPELRIALARLPSHEREALLLFTWADLSYDEIALALDVRLGTVRSRIHRARERLRRALDSEGESSQTPPGLERSVL
jgi:RNA polymerase sigma-70 factor (ECF subfamily)